MHPFSCDNCSFAIGCNLNGETSTSRVPSYQQRTGLHEKVRLQKDQVHLTRIATPTCSQRIVRYMGSSSAITIGTSPINFLRLHHLITTVGGWQVPTLAPTTPPSTIWHSQSLCTPFSTPHLSPQPASIERLSSGHCPRSSQTRDPNADSCLDIYAVTSALTRTA